MLQRLYPKVRNHPEVPHIVRTHRLAQFQRRRPDQQIADRNANPLRLQQAVNLPRPQRHWDCYRPHGHSRKQIVQKPLTHFLTLFGIGPRHAMRQFQNRNHR